MFALILIAIAAPVLAIAITTIRGAAQSAANRDNPKAAADRQFAVRNTLDNGISH